MQVGDDLGEQMGAIRVIQRDTNDRELEKTSYWPVWRVSRGFGQGWSLGQEMVVSCQ